ncbi:hypothetical protein CR513_36732, partial [Mucuna pruriens]
MKYCVMWFLWRQGIYFWIAHSSLTARYTNRFSFIYNELKITRAPLSPKQVFESQIKIRKVRECEKSKEKESSSGLPPIRGIEHHTNLIPRAALPNRPAYRNRPTSWEECLPRVKFAYKKTVHSNSIYSSFEVVYDFNPLTPLDILTLSTNEHANLDGKQKTEFVRKLHVNRANIEKMNEQYARQANKGRVKVTFELGDWVWVYLFPIQRKYKLQPRGDEPFQVLERINDNAYKLDLPIAYDNVSEKFDLRTNLFEEGGNDRDPTNKAKNPLHDIGGLITRPKTKMMKQFLQGLIVEIKKSLEQSGLEVTTKWVTLSQVNDD